MTHEFSDLFLPILKDNFGRIVGHFGYCYILCSVTLTTNPELIRIASLQFEHVSFSGMTPEMLQICHRFNRKTTGNKEVISVIIWCKANICILILRQFYRIGTFCDVSDFSRLVNRPYRHANRCRQSLFCGRCNNGISRFQTVNLTTIVFFFSNFHHRSIIYLPRRNTVSVSCIRVGSINPNSSILPRCYTVLTTDSQL